MHLPAYVYHISFCIYRPLNLPLSCEIAKMVVFGPPICRERDTLDFGHAFSNYTYCGRIWFSSVRRSQTLEGEKKKEERKKNRW